MLVACLSRLLSCFGSIAVPGRFNAASVRCAPVAASAMAVEGGTRIHCDEELQRHQFCFYVDFFNDFFAPRSPTSKHGRFVLRCAVGLDAAAAAEAQGSWRLHAAARPARFDTRQARTRRSHPPLAPAARARARSRPRPHAPTARARAPTTTTPRARLLDGYAAGVTSAILRSDAVREWARYGPPPLGERPAPGALEVVSGAADGALVLRRPGGTEDGAPDLPDLPFQG